jgi:hypothetical protein
MNGWELLHASRYFIGICMEREENHEKSQQDSQF